MSALTREDNLAHSVFDFAKDAIEDRYSGDYVEVLESFTGRLQDEQMTRNYVAVGFSYDRDAEDGELGSTLRIRPYLIEFFVFGRTHDEGQNLAGFLKFVLDRDDGLPLRDYAQTGAPEIDRLVVDATRAERQPIANPEPWQEYVWVTTLQITDTYYADLAA